MDDSGSFERRLASDREALRQATAQGLPDLAKTARGLRLASQSHGTFSNGGTLMTMLQNLRSRPRFVTALVGGALCAGVLLLPVSYERTVGQTVTLHVAAGSLGPGGAAMLARRARKELHAQSVQLRQKMGPGSEQPELMLIATLPVRSAAQAQALASGLVEALGKEHVTATAEVSARTMLTSGRVYAMALDKLISIRVDTAGKSDAEVTTEIKSQLESSGIHGADVTFERHGDEAQMQIAADVDGRQVQVMRQTKGGPSQIDVDIGGIDDTRDPGMTDDQLRDKIVRQLQARGLDPTVTVTGDHIEIRAHKPADPTLK